MIMENHSLTRHCQRLLLLVCYTALLVPRAHGVILCINPCGIASVEAAAHHCHGGEHTHEVNHPEHTAEILAPGSLPEHSHSDNCCTDVPLGTETPQLVNPAVVIPPLARSLSNGTLPSSPTPSFCLTEKATDPPPRVSEIATTILQL